MIKSINIQNFQSLVDVDIEPGQFTVLIGASDLGKSAIVRALESLIHNRTGQGFIRHGQKGCFVGLNISESHIVEWTKGKSASYSVDGKYFEKIGGSVPEEVSDVLKMGEVIVGGVKLFPNIHSQFDAPFLVTESTASKAKILGEISGLNILYSATQEGRRIEQSLKKSQSIKLNDLELLKERLVEFDFLKDWELKLQESSELFKEVDIFSDSVDYLVFSLIQYDKLLKVQEKIESAVTDYEDLISLIEEADVLLDTCDKVESAIESVNSLSKVESIITFQIEGLSLELAELEEILDELNVCPTCEQTIESASMLIGE